MYLSLGLTISSTLSHGCRAVRPVQEPPREGETVYIGPGQTILLDIDTPVVSGSALSRG